MTSWLATETAAQLAWTLIHFLWQGVAVAALYLAAERSVHGRAARHRYLLSLSFFVVMAACPFVTWHVLTPQSVIPAAPATASDFVAASEPTTLVAAAAPIGTSPAALPAADAGFPWETAVLGAWLAGVCLMGVRLLAGFWGLRRLQRDRLRLPDTLQRTAARLAQRLGLPGFRRVFASGRVGEALAVGFLRPAVLLPAAWLTELPPSVLEAVIAHELAHIRRFDLWINALQRVVETLLFYHPAVWWLSARVRDEREMCCDELAAAATGEQLEYARALEIVAQHASVHPSLLTASMTGDNRMHLLRRVRNVLGLAPSAGRSLGWPAGLLTLLLPFALWATVGTADDETPGREGDPAPRAERESDPPPRERERFERERGERGEGERGERERRGPEGERERRGPEGERDLRAEVEQLRREVAELRELLRRERAGREGPPFDGPRGRGPRDFPPPRRFDGPARERFEGPGRGPRDGDARPPEGRFRPPIEDGRRERPGRERLENVFRAYDKDGNGKVSFEEWLAMREGDIDDRRRAQEQERFARADRNRDEGIDADEFFADRAAPPRREGPPGDRPRDGEGPRRRGPRDGERPRAEGPPGERPPRDGEGPGRRGPRDGERPRPDGPPGERPRPAGPPEGDRPRRPEGETERPNPAPAENPAPRA